MRNVLLICFFILSGCQSLQYNREAQVIPIKLHSHCEIPILQLKVNGKEMPSIFDSGAYFNACIDENILQKVGAIPLAEQQRSTDGRGAVLFRKLYEADLQIGDVKFGKLKTEIFAPWGYSLVDGKHQDISEFHDSLNMDNVYVGSGLFKNYNILWNLKDEEIVLYPLSDTSVVDEKGWVSGNFSITQNGYEFNLTSGEHEFVVMIDSGCNCSAVSNTRYNIFSKAPEGKMVKLDGLKFAGQALDAISVAIIESHEPSVDILLGCDFLKKYMVFFDMQNKKIWIKVAS